MGSSLSERIQAAILAKGKNREKRRERNYRPLFLAAWEEIRDALGKGYSVKSIWQSLHEEGKYPATYDSFLKHVRVMQRGTTPDTACEKTPQKEANSVVVSGKFVSSELPTFNMDAVGSKEDLF